MWNTQYKLESSQVAKFLPKVTNANQHESREMTLAIDYVTYHNHILAVLLSQWLSVVWEYLLKLFIFSGQYDQTNNVFDQTY